MIKANKDSKKIEEITKMCQAAIAKQVEQNHKGGASLARNILRLIGSTY